MQITLIGNKSGVYIDPETCNAYIDYQKANNIQDVKIFGVNNLVIRRYEDGSFKIVQAGGYNNRQGGWLHYVRFDSHTPFSTGR